MNHFLECNRAESYFKEDDLLYLCVVLILLKDGRDWLSIGLEGSEDET